MLLKDIIQEAGIEPSAKSSARRAIVEVLDRSVGAIPTRDLIDLLKIVAAALDVKH